MASGMKWLTSVIIGSVLVTAWAGTVSTDPPAVPPAYAARAELADSISATVRTMLRAHDAYREFARADSLLPLLPDSPAYAVILPAALGPAARVAIETRVAAEIAAAGAPRARTGVFLIDDRFGGREGAAFYGPGEQRDLYAGTDSAGAYCAMVGTGDVSDGGMRDDVFTSMLRAEQYWATAWRGRAAHTASILGPCAFFARYGAPGADVTHWLEGGAYTLAELPGPVPDGDVVRMSSGGDLRLRACIGGRSESCADVVMMTDQPSRRRAGAATYKPGRVSLSSDPGRRRMLSDLETAMGRDRFERFWTGSGDVQAAFESAFGVKPESWVREWGEARYGAVSLGAGVDGWSLLLSGLAVALLGGLTAFVATRRTV